MAIKLYGIYAENGECVKVLQAKRKDVAEKCIAEYIRIGSIPCGKYHAELIVKEGKSYGEDDLFPFQSGQSRTRQGMELPSRFLE